MSKFASPIPVQTKIVDNLDMSIPWSKWLKTLGDDWVTSNKVQTVSGTNFNYTVNGILLFFHYTSTETKIIKLPYIVGSDSVIDGNIIVKGTTEITLSKPLSGSYFIQF